MVNDVTVIQYFGYVCGMRYTFFFMEKCRMILFLRPTYDVIEPCMKNKLALVMVKLHF